MERSRAVVNDQQSSQQFTSLFEAHEVIKRLEPQQAIGTLAELADKMEEDPEAFRENLPDTFHNLGVHADETFNNCDLGIRIFTIGASLFPDNVDLVADLLSMYVGKRFSPPKAAAVWDQLQKIDPAIRNTYWRYWVFGAQYQLKIRHDFESARTMLEQGAKAVYGDEKAKVLRALGTVLIDGTPDPQYEAVMSAWKQAIAAGHETAYILCTQLAELIQRMAGAERDPDKRNQKLQEALDWLDMAEAVFTGDQNHPVTEIYRARINVLMGLARYREAIEYVIAVLSSNPESLYDSSLLAQLVLACERNGEAGRWKEIIKGAGSANIRMFLANHGRKEEASEND
jgi:tetratricopeptide (TPR) repeat protein